VLRVAAGGAQWFADVGFGSGLLAPLPLAATGPHRQGAWQYELRRGPDGAWRLHEHDGERWTAILTFTEEPQYFVDIDAANYYSATHPHSPFVARPVVVRKDETSVRRWLGRDHTVERPGRGTDRRHLGDREYAAALRSEFGAALSSDEIAALVAATAPADEGTRR
jgi:N-hydroxyarylamine O-acetyltransferase